jgi:regulatory protein YycH of two-component signal transduction system YycFG
MVYFNKEKVKSIILVILILTSLVQVGILWVYQSHRFPFSFFSTVFGRNSIEDNTDIEQKARKEVLIPYRIIVSNGNNVHWLLKENEEIFHILWDEGLEYVKRALSEGGGQIVDFNIWDKLVVSKSFAFEFKKGIKSNLVKWFLNIPIASSAEHSESIRKIMILPDEDINKNNTLYILTNKNLSRKFEH